MKIPPIIISGMAAVGKSTLARRIAKKFGLKYVCGGDILKEIAREDGYNPTDEGWWETEEGMEFLRRRQRNPAYDRKLDAKLIEIAKKGDCVLTSWSLPWIYKGKAIKIWLDASEETRAKRLANRDKIDLSTAFRIIKQRDVENIKLYKKIYGFELGKDLSVFDLVIKTDGKNADEVEKEVTKFLVKLLKKLVKK